MWAGRETFRHVDVLIRRLPVDSALAAELPPASPGSESLPPRWGHGEHLLADIYDVLAGANWQRAGAQAKRPRPYPRPRDQAARPRMTSEQRDRLLARRPRGGDDAGAG